MTDLQRLLKSWNCHDPEVSHSIQKNIKSSETALVHLHKEDVEILGFCTLYFHKYISIMNISVNVFKIGD